MNYLLQLDASLRDEKSLFIRSGLAYSYVSFADLKAVQDVYSFVPVGSVEFIQKYALLNGIRLPASDTYPECIQKWLFRPLEKTTFGLVPASWFCKPVKTKVFTGGLKSGIGEAVASDEAVWCSPPVQFIAEFRVYVLNGKVLGFSRYDDGDDEQSIDMKIAEQMIADYAMAPRGYAIDVGIANGETVLVEVNDGWALGYYRWGNIGAEDYIKLITERWQQILENF